MMLEGSKVEGENISYIETQQFDLLRMNELLHKEIEERKRIEQALRQSEMRYRSLFENSYDAILILNKKTHCFEACNPRATELFGYSEEAFQGMTIFNICPEYQDYDIPTNVFYEHYQGLIEENMTVYFELLFHSARGRVFEAEVSILPVNAPNSEQVLFVIRDISSRKKRELQLEESERSLALSHSLLEATIESTADGILVVNNLGETVCYNQKFCQMWEIPEEILTNKKDIEVIGLMSDKISQPKLFIDYTKSIYNNNDSVSLDELQFKDGRILERHSQPQLIKGKVVGRVWSFRDVTDKKMTLQELEVSNESLKRFTSVASHDMKEPVRMIISFGQLLQFRYKKILDKSGREYLQYIQGAAEQMNSLIVNLLEYAKAGTLNQEPQAVNLEDIVEVVKDNLRLKILETQTIIFHQNLPTIHVHFTYMLQLFQNIISNGIKFQKAEVKPQIVITAKQLPDAHLISIQDNGIGIASENQCQIFEAFKRLHTKQEYEGSGIGLSTCKKIVDSYGGKIWIESELGKGTIFNFTIPFK
ncbi:MAG: ATP-binding protein [Chitinophagales bacterium]